eukprot:547447-Rhodomonas_salina.1
MLDRHTSAAQRAKPPQNPARQPRISHRNHTPRTQADKTPHAGPNCSDHMSRLLRHVLAAGTSSAELSAAASFRSSPFRSWGARCVSVNFLTVVIETSVLNGRSRSPFSTVDRDRRRGWMGAHSLVA